MSPLAFDKQGRPFSFQRRTAKLLVRRFKNQGTRGTCAAVLNETGEPLYADPEMDYLEFRKLVGNVPGFYRLDQCDDDGNELDDAEPAYVSIDATRNASPPGEGDPNPLVIIEHLVAIQADCMKTMATQQASIIAASAEILRAPFRPAAPSLEKRDDGGDRDDNEECDCEGCQRARAAEPMSDAEGAEEDPWAQWRPMLKMVEPHLPKLGAFLYEQFVAFMKKNATPPPAAAPSPHATPEAPPAAAAAPSPGPVPADAAAGPSASSASAVSSSAASSPTPSAAPAAPSPSVASTTAAAGTSSTETEHATEAARVAATVATTPPAPSASLAVVPASAETTARNATPPTPTPAQWAHLAAIRERLAPDECAIAENAIMRMSADVLAQWLAELSAMSVDDAVRTIRGMIAKLRAPRDRDRR